MKPLFLSSESKILSAEEVKEKGKTIGVVKSYAAAFNNVDFGDDRIIPGAFKRTIKNSNGKWNLLADHNPYTPIGYSVGAKEDDHGLLVEEHFNLEIELARDRYSLTKQALDNDITRGRSIGYAAIKVSFEKDEDTGRLIRNLEELKMFEHSDVTFPMNDQAYAVAAKGWQANTIDEAIDCIIEASVQKGMSKKEVLQKIEAIAKKYSDSDSLLHSVNELANFFRNQNKG